MIETRKAIKNEITERVFHQLVRVQSPGPGAEIGNNIEFLWWDSRLFGGEASAVQTPITHVT